MCGQVGQANAGIFRRLDVRTRNQSRHIRKSAEPSDWDASFTTTVHLPSVLIERLSLLSFSEGSSVSAIIEYILHDSLETPNGIIAVEAC